MSIYEMYYDEINAELLQMSAIELEETAKKIYIGSGEDLCKDISLKAFLHNGVVICEN